MSSKITGWWPQSRSTSRPYPRLWLLSPGDPIPLKTTLDMALNLSGEQRDEHIEWLLDERRKELMMDRHYQSEMQEAARGLPFEFTHPWMSDSQRRFTRYVVARAKQAGVEI